MLVSCSKDGATDSSLTTEDQNEFNSPTLKKKNFFDHGNSDLEFRSTTETCNCYYEIIDVDIDLPTPQTDYRYTLTTGNAACSNSTFGCPYMHGQYCSISGCCSSNPDPSCYDYFTQPIPQGVFPFNCQISRYLSFPIDFLTRDCSTFFPLDGQITFKVYCSESNSTESCFEGGGYGWPSEEVTLVISNGGYSDQALVELSEPCGCTPVITL